MADSERSSFLYLIVILIIGIGILSLFFGGGMMMGGIMGIGLLLPVIFIILLIYALSDNDRPVYGQPMNHDGEGAIRVLDRRYANSEISREEYFKIRNDIYDRYR